MGLFMPRLTVSRVCVCVCVCVCGLCITTSKRLSLTKEGVYAPAVKFGKLALSMGNDSASVMCQCSVFSFEYAIASSWRRITLTGRKWRAESNMRPRCCDETHSQDETYHYDRMKVIYIIHDYIAKKRLALKPRIKRAAQRGLFKKRAFANSSTTKGNTREIGTKIISI
jgi:hypothetical protein